MTTQTYKDMLSVVHDILYLFMLHYTECQSTYLWGETHHLSSLCHLPPLCLCYSYPSD